MKAHILSLVILRFSPNIYMYKKVKSVKLFQLDSLFISPFISIQNKNVFNSILTIITMDYTGRPVCLQRLSKR